MDRFDHGATLLKLAQRRGVNPHNGAIRLADRSLQALEDTATTLDPLARLRFPQRNESDRSSVGHYTQTI